MAEGTQEPKRNRRLIWWIKVVVPILGIVFTFLGVLVQVLPKISDGAPHSADPMAASSPAEPALSKIVRGRVLDARSLAPVAAARVEAELRDGVESAYSDSRGVFQLRLPAAPASASFRLRVEAEGFEPYLLETTADLIGGRLNDLRLSPVSETPVSARAPSPGGGRDAAIGNTTPLLVTVAQGATPREIPALGAFLSVRFELQEGQQTAVLTFAGGGGEVSRAFFGPGGKVPVDSAAGRYEMSLMSWDPAARRATVVFRKVTA